MGKKISAYDPGDGDGGEFIIAKGGANYKVTGNAPMGPVILDANGKILSRLGYEGQPGGVATLDAAGTVVEAVTGQLRSYVFARGTTTIYSTTADIGQYVLPDPRPTISVEEGDIVVMDFKVGTKVASGEYAFAIPVYSSDGGSTFNFPDGALYTSYNISATIIRVPLTGRAIIPVSAGVTSLILGISIGTESGGTQTVYTNGYRWISALIFRGTSG